MQHAVESPCVLPYHPPRLLPAPYTGARSLHIATRGTPFLLSPTSSLLPPPSTPSTLPQPRPCCILQPLDIHMGVPRSRCSTPWSHHALCLPHMCFNISNAYPLPAPSSHWGFHVADAARRGVTMCSALPPTSSLACTLYWRHVPLPPRVNLRVSVPCVSHFIPLACILYFHPVYTAMAPSLRPPAP